MINDNYCDPENLEPAEDGNYDEVTGNEIDMVNECEIDMV